MLALIDFNGEAGRGLSRLMEVYGIPRGEVSFLFGSSLLNPGELGASEISGDKRANKLGR